MALDLFGKLEKLKITGYTDVQRSSKAPGESEFEVMFNPTSLSTSYTNVYSSKRGINTMGGEVKYAYGRSKDVNFDIILDGSGVTEMGILSLFGSPPTVPERVQHFIDLCFKLQGDPHQPYFLKIQWGKGDLEDFDCRLISVDIEYSSFEKNGEPRYAVLKTHFREDVDSEKRSKEISLTSPDLTHVRIVKHGDTLPLLSKAIYGSSKHYLWLAQKNNLNNFRDLTPGMELIFPPLES